MSLQAITARQIGALRALVDQSDWLKRNRGREWVPTKDLDSPYVQRALEARRYIEGVRVFGGHKQWRPTLAGRQALLDYDGAK